MIWVVFDRPSRPYLSVDVRLAPQATEVLPQYNRSLCANNRHWKSRLRLTGTLGTFREVPCEVIFH